MTATPSLVFIPGSWHRSTCYDKVIKLLQTDHHIRCTAIDLPSTSGPDATFKNDVDVARDTLLSEIRQGRNTIVVAHSYGGMVANSAIKDLTKPKSNNSASTTDAAQGPRSGSEQNRPNSAYVTALILVASGFTITGLSFMDPLFGHPPPLSREQQEEENIYDIVYLMLWNCHMYAKHTTYK